MHRLNLHRSATSIALTLLGLASASPAAAQILDPLGKESYPVSLALADRLAASQPATAWETDLDGEAADLMEFIGEDLLLIGLVEVNRNADPKHGRLHMFDIVSGRERWSTGRRDMGTGGYEVLATEPWIILHGSDDEEGRITALDAESGDRKWEVETDGVSSVTLSTDGPSLLVLDRRESGAHLRSVQLEKGRRSWEVDLPGALAGPDTPVSLMTHSGRVFVVGRGIIEVDATSGGLFPHVEIPGLHENGGSVLGTDDALVVWAGRSVSLFEPGTRSVRWSHGTEGEIHTVTSIDGHIIAVTGPETTPRLHLLDGAQGTAVWSSDIGETLTGPVAKSGQVIIVPVATALVGLDLTTGEERFRTPLPDEAAAGSPTLAEYVGMPDVVRSEDRTLFLARERAGLLAFDLPGGELRWFRPHHEAPGALGRYSGEARYAHVLEAQLMQAGGAIDPGASIVGLGIGSGTSSLLAAAQRDHDAARTRYDALGSAASAGERSGAGAAVRTAAELGVAAAQLEASMGQMTAGVDLARSIISLRDVIRSYNVAAGRQGLVDRATLAMRSGLLMQSRLFQSGHYVRPFVMEGTGRGVSVVRLESGLRADPVYSPINGPSFGYGLDLGVVRASPSGERIAVVGISLDTDRWDRRDKWGTHVPRMSLLTYETSDLDFGERPRLPYLLHDLIRQDDIGALRRALESGGDPNAVDPTTGVPALNFAVSYTKVDAARLLLEAGADPNAESPNGDRAIGLALNPDIVEILFAAGAEEPEYVKGANVRAMLTPIFTAVSAQNPELVREAIADGGDPNLQIGQGQTVLYLAIAMDNPETVRVLLEAGATMEWEDVNGDSPLDVARSEAVKAALRGR